jgi:hypothetical protein
MPINLLEKRPLQCRDSGTFPDGFEISEQTTARQDRARIPLWSGGKAHGEVLIAAILIPA